MENTNFITEILIVFASGICIFAERAFPFLLFSKKNPPKAVKFIQKFIPSTVMACLLVYSLKDVSFVLDGKIYLKGFLPHFSSIFLVIILQFWKKNTLLSIFGGTALYMILLRIL